MAENIDPIKQLFDDLFTLLEAQETQTIAVMELLRDAGIGSEEKMKPYLERAGNAASVKWRAARVRMEYLLTPVNKKEDEKKEEGKEKKGAEAFWENKPEGEKKDGEKQDDSKKETGTQGKESMEKPTTQSSKSQGASQENSPKQSGDKQGSDKPAAKTDDKEKAGSEKGEDSSKAWGPSGGDKK